MPLSPSAQKVQDALAAAGFACEVVELEASTRTSAEAAAAVGTDIARGGRGLDFESPLPSAMATAIARRGRG